MLKKNDVNEMCEEIKTIKTEISDVKTRISSLTDIKKEEVFKGVISTLQKDIEGLEHENKDIIEKIIHFEEELDDTDSDESLHKDIAEVKISKSKETHINKCNKYDFTCEREITLRKHINTEHCE